MKTHISSRETQVLNLIAYEYTNYEIADQLHISHHTAMSHRKNLLQKLSVKNSAGLIRKAFELGIMTLPIRNGTHAAQAS